MAKQGDADEGELIDPAVQQDGPYPGLAKMDGRQEGDELSLEEILMLYNQPINEEQAWAVCYQCCRSLAQGHGRRNSTSAAGASVVDYAKRVEGPRDVRIQRDGAVSIQYEGSAGTQIQRKYSLCTSTEVIESLGIMIYKALDFGLKENEERELSPPLEQLIDMMTNMGEAEREAESEACPDEGYEATEEEEEGEDADGVTLCSTRGYRHILRMCTSHLPSPADAPVHYQAVCRALYAETRELHLFLEKIRSAKENLKKMEGRQQAEDPSRDLNELQNDDWAVFWVQVMRDLRHGVKLKKVHERQYNPLAIEFQLTPYEMLMDDIRSKRYKLRKVMVNGDVPPKLKKSAHEVILDFIRSRPPLNPVASRKLKPQAQPPPTLHERILEGIKSERKLRPVSPDEIRRSRLGAYLSRSTPQDLFRTDGFTPEMTRKTSSTMCLANGSLSANSSPRVGSMAGGPPGGSGGLTQRKRLLKAPRLEELVSSDSDDDETVGGRRSASSSSVATSAVDDTSPESVLGRKTPPMFLPISSTPQPERRQAPQRRHSIEKETPTNVRQFLPPSRQSSKSLEEFCFPVECLSLTVEEVMHIRQVLVKAELEKFQQYKDIYNALKKGKLCFCCRTKRFSFFTWSYTCQFCKRPVCSQCCKKMRLPSKPYASLPIYSLGSTNTLPRDRLAAMAAVRASSAAAGRGAGGGGAAGGGALRGAADAGRGGAGRGGVGVGRGGAGVGVGRGGAGKGGAVPKAEKASSSHHRPSLQKTMSKLAKHGGDKSCDELELPPELTEDWATMEVCVDCKKFISEIISSSKHSLSLATKRARLKRKTQSFYTSSPKGASEYRPSERTINEI
ncbi:LOW QUALITY PROTEIN: protein spire homolog 1 [Osmerus eperlanus]|uniref:LOW QUALITY PROTEIN: protein spire homolog 1 n=1 Tax=Osmerus eperlanus TaxID=29151 RepID=UPI002E10C047